MSKQTARLHSTPAAPHLPVQVAQAVPSETLQMEPPARNNQQSMTSKKDRRKVRVRSGGDGVGLSEHLPVI